MTYPLQVKAAQERIIKAQDERIAKLNAELPALTDAAAAANAKQALAAAEKAKTGAQGAINALGDSTTSLVGLSEPLFPLRNPGLVSIPLGFLAVLIGSLLYRDKRAEEMWEELYVRSHTGIGRAAASAH
jgi:cation/acetate symporter